MRFPLWLVVVGVVALGLAGWGIGTPRLPEDAHFGLDLAALERLAAEPAGARPTHVNVLSLGSVSKPLATIIGGAVWGEAEMPSTSYQIVSPEWTLIVDLPSLERASAESIVALRDAVAAASGVVFTHEHGDHMGGLVALRSDLGDPELVQRSPAQGDPSGEARAALPDTEPIAVAPGVVSIPAAGHTPGSRIVYVLTQTGDVLLLVGDIAWHRVHYAEPRGHPRLSGLALGEDSAAIAGQLRALHRLASVAGVRIVPSHDAALLASLRRAGPLRRGFE